MAYKRKHDVRPPARASGLVITTMPPPHIQYILIKRLEGQGIGLSFQGDKADRPTITIEIGGLGGTKTLEDAFDLFEEQLTNCLDLYRAGLLRDEEDDESVLRL